ncbi:probable serine protease/ABC transporter B family protein tagD [Coccomyxa sp. Obi]|nr:probable serine protease/ABC transporter B family protein tagD [Coccomyxa sp. Obi]
MKFRHKAKRRGLLESRAEVTSDERWGVLRGPEQFLISMRGPLHEETLQRVKLVVNSHDGWLSSYIPDSTMLGIGSSNCAEAVRHVPGVVWVGEYKPEYKLSGDWKLLLEEASAGKLHETLRQHHEQLNAGKRSFRGALAPELAHGGGLRVVIHVHFPTVRNNTAARLSGSGAVAGYASAEAAAADWGTAAKRHFGAAVALRPEGGSILAVSAEPNVLQEVLVWLTKQPAVNWLVPRAAVRQANWQGSAIVQSGNAAADAPMALAHDNGAHPIWAAGLTGAGQIIGGGDSGIDRHHCFFDDPNVDWNFNLVKDPSSGSVTFSSEKHRKIRLYVEMADGIDNSGHGTHTMGTIVGNPLNTSNTDLLDYKGLAPDAKVAFTDLASATTKGRMETPWDLAEEYFPASYNVGARVHSNSWGLLLEQDYNSYASQVDMFTWEHQDLTVVFAAGNEEPENGTTILSPASSKNCIAVGATNAASQQDDWFSPLYPVYKMSIRHVLEDGSQAVDDYSGYRVVDTTLGFSFTSLFKQQFVLGIAQPADGCTPLNNAAEVAGTVLIVLNGTCTFSTKAFNARAASAKAVLVYQDNSGDYFSVGLDQFKMDLLIPQGTISRHTGQLLISYSLAEANLTVSFSNETASAKPFESLTDFSSSGPTNDGRIKPDLAAPGILTSVKAHTDGSNTCSLIKYQGTSMASPLVAASAALVWQYFMSGFYPSGVKLPANQFAPSGALVKAVLLGGAAAMDGFEIDTGLPLAPPPSFRQGFGRAHLGRSLPLQGSALDWKLQVINMANLSTGQAHHYCLEGLGGPLSVTLVWHDYPAAISTSKTLVNDLDLTIRAAGLNGFPFLGNGGGISSDGKYTFAPDHTNNVEQVSVPYLPPKQVAIEVRAFQTFSIHGPQSYALAVLGKFSGTLASPGNPATWGSAQQPQPDACHVINATITKGPHGPINNSTVAFTFTTSVGNPSRVKFGCVLANGTASSGNVSTAYRACTSPVTYTDLADGPYTFIVRAHGEEFAVSVPAQASFLIDTTPPIIAHVAFPFATRNTSIIASFSVTDSGSGVNNTECRMQPMKLAVSNNTAMLKGPRYDWAPCSSPAYFGDLAEGKWGLSIRAEDNVGLLRQTNEADIYVSHTPPNATVVGGPMTGTPTPSQVTFSFVSQVSGGDAGAPIAYSLCLMQPIHISQMAPPQQGMGRASGQLQSASNLTAAASWTNCTSPAVFRGLRSGIYTFQVKSVDVAGNVGTASRPYAFTVDDTLPILVDPPWWFTGWRRIAIIAGAAGAAALLVLALACCACCAARRRRLQQLHPEGTTAAEIPTKVHHDVEPGATAQPSISKQPQQSNASKVDERMQLQIALDESLEEQRVRRALAQSLVEQGSPRKEDRGTPVAARGNSDELRRALQESLEEEQLRRALAESERSAVQPMPLQGNR